MAGLVPAMTSSYRLTSSRTRSSAKMRWSVEARGRRQRCGAADYSSSTGAQLYCCQVRGALAHRVRDTLARRGGADICRVRNAERALRVPGDQCEPSGSPSISARSVPNRASASSMPRLIVAVRLSEGGRECRRHPARSPLRRSSRGHRRRPRQARVHPATATSGYRSRGPGGPPRVESWWSG
jgi:hypothetical protein